MRSIRAGLFVLIGLFAAGGVQAHHSVAMFDAAKTDTLKGTVLRFEWTNPHAWIWIIPDNSTAQHANGFECGALGMLRRLGWKREDLKPGDKVVMTYHPYQDGLPGGMMLSVRFADGRILGNGMPGGPPHN